MSQPTSPIASDSPAAALSPSPWPPLVRRLMGLDEAGRLGAIADLGRLGDSPLSRAALQCVAGRDTSATARRDAREALRACGGPLSGLVETVGRELGSRDVSQREAAGWVALLLQNRDLAPILRQRLRDEATPSVRIALLLAIASSGGSSDLMVIVPLLDAAEVLVRTAALRAAIALGGTEADPYLVRALADSSKDVRSAALAVLSGRGWPGIKTLLSRMAASSIPWHPESAAFVLGGTRNAEAVSILHSLQAHPSAVVRERVEQALQQLGRAGIAQAATPASPSSPPSDRQELSVPGSSTLDPQPSTRFTPAPSAPPPDAPVPPPQATQRINLLAIHAAAKAPQTQDDALAWARQLVEEQRAEHWADLAQRLEREPDPIVASYLISCLGRLGARAALPRLLPFLGHPVDRIRANTVEALRLLAGSDQLDALLPLLDDPNNRVRGNAIVALLGQPGFDPLKHVAALISSSEENWQLTAIYVARVLGTPAARAAVRSLRASPHATVRAKLGALLGQPSEAAPAKSGRLHGLVWATALAALVLLIVLPFYLMESGPAAEDAPRALSRREQRQLRTSTWTPEVPSISATEATSRGAFSGLGQLLSDPQRDLLEAELSPPTTPEAFEDRWKLLYGILAALPSEARARIVTLADMCVLWLSRQSRGAEACERLDDWLKRASVALAKERP